MRTFDEKDLITWSNRDQAKIGEKYYFADSLSSLKVYIEDPSNDILDYIDEDNLCAPFINRSGCQAFNYACILPVDAVYEIKPEKRYRPFKNFKELFNLLNDMSDSSLTFSETDCIYDLISDQILHLRSKINNTEYYDRVVTIVIEESSTKICTLHTKYANFSDLFEEFEIEINGEWQPFGIEETAE